MRRRGSARRVWIGGALLLGALGAVGAWAWFRPFEVSASEPEAFEPLVAGGSTPDRQGVARVEAVPARRQDLSLRKEATGYLEARRRVAVAAEVGGRVIERRVEEGVWVEAGEILIRLDDRDRRLEVLEAEAEWLKIRAQYAVNYEMDPGETGAPAASAPPETTGPETASPERLFRQGLISQQEMVEAGRRAESDHLLSGRDQGDVRAASTGLVQAEQRRARARLALERTEILAPFSGRVADLAVELGQQVASGEALLTLLDDSRMEVDVDVLDADVVRLRRGAPARVRIPALDDAELEGAVETINPRVDPETGTGRVTVSLPNRGGRLLPGLFAYVALEVGRLPDRIVVPVPAVLERQDRELVFRIENGRALWTYVETGARSGGLVEIVDGLAEGDLVAVADHFALAHEAPVEWVDRPDAGGADD